MEKAKVTIIGKSDVWFIPTLLIGGLLWIRRAVLEFSKPNYWNPRMALDYSAVVGTSLMFLFLPAASWGLYHRYPLPSSKKQKVWQVRIALAILAALAVAVSNFIEDAC